MVWYCVPGEAAAARGPRLARIERVIGCSPGWCVLLGSCRADEGEAGARGKWGTFPKE